MNTVDDLDRALRDLEQLAPDAGELRRRLARELAARPRRAHTARLAICAAATVVVAVAILAIALASGGHSHPVAPGDHSSPVRPSPTSPSSTAASPSATSTSRSAKPAAVSSFDLDWHFRMQRVPGYVITRESITASDQQARVTALVGGTRAHKDIGGIDVYSPGVVPSELATLRKGSPVSVRGDDGYFAITGESSALIWLYAPGSWAEVSGDWGYDAGSASGTQHVDPTLARAGELEIARAVTTGVRDPLRIDFTIGYLPRGLHLQGTKFYADFGGQPLCELDFADSTPGQDTADGPSPALSITRTALATDTGQPGNSAFVPNTTVAARPANYSSGFLAVRYPYKSELDIWVDPKHTARYRKADLTAIAEHAAPAGKPADATTWTTGSAALPH